MRSIGITGFRAWTLAGVASAAIVSPAWAQEARQTYDMPARDLPAALEAFGRQSGKDVLFDRAQTTGKMSAPVIGAYTADEALRRLLDGSGLVVRRVNVGTFIVEPRRPQDLAAAPDAADSDTAQVEDVIVTGSHIRGAVPASPVHILTRADIDRSGFSQIGDLVRSLPENFGGGQNPGVVEWNYGNASTVDLRGLGADATLVLVNGHRLAGYGTSQASDISGIPLAALQRVEIVTDGSSAVYGADAVAGVANFILRRDFKGTEVSARLGGATQGGGFEQTYSVLTGVSQADWYAMANVEYSKQDAIKASDRDFTASAAAAADLISPQERTSVYMGVGRDFNENIAGSVDVLLGERDVDGVVQYNSVSPQNAYSMRIPTYSVAANLDVVPFTDWRFLLTGVISGGRLTDSGTDRTTTVQENELRYAEAVLDGPIVRLPSGNLDVAIGVGARRESYDGNAIEAFRNVTYVFGEALIPLGPTSPRPGFHDFDISLSARWEDYSDFGASTTPKIGVRYVPMEGLILRGTWGKSFKAPAFVQMYSPQSALLYPASILGYSGGGTLFYLTGGNASLKPENSTSWTFSSEYRPSWSPSASFTATYFNIDYTDRVAMPVTQAFGALVNPDYAPFVMMFPTAAEQAQIIAGVSRFLNLTGSPYDSADTAAVVHNEYTNVAAQAAEGIDLGYRQSFAVGSGNLNIYANATWAKLDQQTLPTTAANRLSGSIAHVPDFRSRAGATWENEAFSATAIVNYVAPLDDTGLVPSHSIASWTTVDIDLSYRFAPSSGPLENLTLSLSAQNLLDKNPPFAESPAALYQGIYFDTTNASAIGRFVAVTLRKRF